MRVQARKCEILPLLATLKNILQNNYVLPRNEMDPVDPKRLLKFAIPLIIGGIPSAIGSIGFLYISLRRNLWPQPLENLIYLTQMLTALLVLIIFIGNSRNYFISINRMSRYSFGAPRRSRNIIKISDKLCTILFYTPKVVFTIQALLMYASNAFCDNQDFEGDDGYVCGSFVPMWFFFKVDQPVVAFTIRICMLYVTISYLPFLSVLIASPLTSCNLNLIRLRKLGKLFLDFNQTSGDKPPTREQLVFFIEYHAEIAECIHDMNESLSYDHLPVQIFMPIILALITYQIVLTRDIVAVCLLAVWSFPYFALCILGELLEHESSTISEIVYSNSWYNIEDAKVRNIYKMFLHWLSRPMRMKLRPLGALNHLIIIKILKTAYSFLIFFIDATK